MENNEAVTDEEWNSVTEFMGDMRKSAKSAQTFLGLALLVTTILLIFGVSFLIFEWRGPPSASTYLWTISNVIAGILFVVINYEVVVISEKLKQIDEIEKYLQSYSVEPGGADDVSR